MRFLDTNVLVYALVTPKRKPLSVQDRLFLKKAKSIVSRIGQGERAMMSVVHLSQLINIVQHWNGVLAACEVTEFLLSIPSLHIMEVTSNHYHLATEIARNTGVGINDCLAMVLMADRNVKELYSFDTDFDKLGIERVTT